MIKIGQGFDIHRLVAGEGFVLGGVFIPSQYAVVAHSDGDVLIHAICDALLGALGMGDIGQHFPDTDPQYHQANSRLFLQTIAGWMQARGYVIGNLDATIIVERPILKTFLPALCETLSADLGCDVSQVNLKAKTHEKLDSIGQHQGIAVHCVVCLNSL